MAILYSTSTSLKLPLPIKQKYNVLAMINLKLQARKLHLLQIFILLVGNMVLEKQACENITTLQQLLFTVLTLRRKPEIDTFYKG